MASLLPPPHAVTIRYSRHPLDERLVAKYDAVLVFCGFSPQKLLQRLPYASLWKNLSTSVHKEGASADLIAHLPNRPHTLMAVGFAKTPVSAFTALTQAARLIKEARLTRYRNVLVDIIGLEESQQTIVREAAIAALLAATAPMPAFKSKPAAAPPLQSITLRHGERKPDLSSTVATHAGNHLARWLTSLPPNRLDSAAYARTLRALATQQGWRYQFYNEAALKRANAGAFLAVARANAHRGAGIVKLSYRPARSAKRVALVGKGICFDTGGINLKTHKSMYMMHEDMQGSAVAVGTLLALTQLKWPVAVDCWLALTENEIGAQAYRPQEVVTAANGITIQVVHSDAEGRMALADTLALASREKPELILDFATLTGSCIGALSERISGVFSNRDTWRNSLEQAGRASGERVWSFPMDEDFDNDLESNVADILQCTMDSKADHILAARFLNRFIGPDIGWVHVDLASSNRPGGLAHIPTDITGFGVRFATEWLMKGDVLG